MMRRAFLVLTALLVATPSMASIGGAIGNVENAQTCVHGDVNMISAYQRCGLNMMNSAGQEFVAVRLESTALEPDTPVCKFGECYFMHNISNKTLFAGVRTQQEWYSFLAAAANNGVIVRAASNNYPQAIPASLLCSEKGFTNISDTWADGFHSLPVAKPGQQMTVWVKNENNEVMREIDFMAQDTGGWQTMRVSDATGFDNCQRTDSNTTAAAAGSSTIRLAAQQGYALRRNIPVN